MSNVECPISPPAMKCDDELIWIKWNKLGLEANQWNRAFILFFLWVVDIPLQIKFLVVGVEILLSNFEVFCPFIAKERFATPGSWYALATSFKSHSCFHCLLLLVAPQRQLPSRATSMRPLPSTRNRSNLKAWWRRIQESIYQVIYVPGLVSVVQSVCTLNCELKSRSSMYCTCTVHLSNVKHESCKPIKGAGRECKPLVLVVLHTLFQSCATKFGPKLMGEAWGECKL